MAESLLHKEPSPVGPVRITSNRRQIDRRFPALGFTVITGGLPFFEVLLTTDRTLFDPANAGRRSPANFYASRQDSGLIRTDPLGAVYMAPPAVLHAFAGSPEVYFTAIAYHGRDGNGPAFAQSPSELPAAAPSVSVSPDLRQAPGAAASVLGIPVSKLSRLRDDGFLSVPAPAEEPLAVDDSGDYDDGFEEPLSEAATWRLDGEEDGDEESYAAAQESTFPAGAEAPPVLEDEDDGPSAAGGVQANAYGEDDSYDDGFGAAGEEAASAAGYDEDAGYDEAAGYDEDGYDDAAGFAAGDEEPPPSASLEAAAQPLSIPGKRKILEQLAIVEPGTDGAEQLGLLYWIAQAGHLGRLLEMVRLRDRDAFRRLFGAHAEKLAQVKAGTDLWREPWRPLFQRAAGEIAFRAAQNEIASELFLDPMLRIAAWLGLNTDRALALVVDRCMQMGPEAAQRWVIEAVGPLKSPAQRQQALAALGHTDLPSFQETTQGVRPDGAWSPLTHAALVASLRAPGSGSPVPIPSRDQMLDALVRHAGGTPWGERTASLRRSTGFSDVVYAL